LYFHSVNEISLIKDACKFIYFMDMINMLTAFKLVIYDTQIFTDKVTP